MPEKFDRCVKQVMEQGKSESDAYAICTAQFKDSESKLSRQFADLATYSAESKTAVSVRDGVLEYLGAEIGLEPADKVFTVYRSPATIANAAYAMSGIPLTDEHVSMDGPAPDTGSSVVDALVIDQIDEATSSRLAVRNKLKVSDSLAPVITDKRQLSLGYEADLVPHSRWDFEQVNIVPHHLAAVPAGRCGPLCSFLDRKPATKPQPEEGVMKLNKAFLDAEGAVSLEQIVEIATALPEAIRKVPVDKLQELMPAMQEVMKYAKEQGSVSDEDLVDEGKVVMTEEEVEDMKTEPKENFADTAEFKDAVESAAKAKAKKLADAEVKLYASVVNKARSFLDEDYDFGAKTANEIMRDALAVEHGETKFEDAELSTAFKLLKKSSPDYSRFGDADHSGGLADRIKSEIGE